MATGTPPPVDQPDRKPNGKAMSLEENKKIAYRAIELWVSGNADNPDAFVSPDYVNHQDSEVGLDAAPLHMGLAHWKAVIKDFRKAFTHVKVTSCMQVAEGDKVATHVSLSAVHSGTFINEMPTNHTIRWDSVEIVRIENGMIMETWVTWDKFDMFQQIGIIS